MQLAGVMSAKGGRRESEIGLDFLREEKDIQMTEEEICKRFKRNGCYKGHIAILVQLNAVDVIAIEKILRG